MQIHPLVSQNASMGFSCLRIHRTIRVDRLDPVFILPLDPMRNSAIAPVESGSTPDLVIITVIVAECS